jgi:hypothetical protein
MAEQMKEVILFLLVLFSLPQFLTKADGFGLMGQEVCSDTIYASKTKKTIIDCCIEKVENENLVIYLKNGERYAIEAKAIVKSGVYIPLKEHESEVVVPKRSYDVATPAPYQKNYSRDYQYYAQKYKKGRIVSGVGGFVSVAGLAMLIGGAASYSNGNLPYETATTLVTVGFFGFHIGMPFFIAGSIMARNNKKAMVGAKQKSLNLSMGVTKNGLGLALKL